MSNIIKFPPSRQSTHSGNGDEPNTALDEMLNTLAASFTAPMARGEKLEFMKKLKGILRSRKIPFKSSPPTGLEVPKTPFTIFVIEAKMAFTLGLKKRQVTGNGWVVHPLNEASPADAAGQVINEIGVREDGKSKE